MPLLRYDETVNVNGREKNIHSTRLLPAAVYDYDVVERPVPWHWHEELELFHLLSGSIVCMIGTSQFRLTSGEAYFVNTEVLHGAWSDTSASCRFHSIVFHPRLIGGDTTSVFWQKYLHPLQLNQSLPFMVFQPVEGWQRQVILQMEQAWELIYADPTHLAGVRVLGVDEHKRETPPWRRYPRFRHRHRRPDAERGRHRARPAVGHGAGQIR